MKVLVASTPGWGHVAPMLPVADELRRRGHQVVWVTAEDAGARLVDRGFDVRAHGMTLAERQPLVTAMLAERASDMPPGLRRPLAFSTFASLAAPAAFDGIRSVAVALEPDVIVREPSELASPLVACTVDVPLVTIGFGGVIPEAARRMADETLLPLIHAAGVNADSDRVHSGDLYLHPMPASMDLEPPPLVTRRVRPPEPRPTAGTTSGFDDLGRSRPAVYATFGTEFGSVAPWGALIEALGESDVDAVVTTGATGLPSGLAVPPNVRVSEYVDQHEVLGRVAAVVSHAGSGTLLGAALRGVPQVCIPLGADQFENAAAAVRRGIAIGIAPAEHDAGAIGGAIARALGARSMTDAAREVSEEIGGAAGPSEAVDWIEALGGVSPGTTVAT